MQQNEGAITKNAFALIKGWIYMRKLLLIFALLACISFASCSGGEDAEQIDPSVPPAFTVLQNRLKLSKHIEKGNVASFSQEEFSSLIGEQISRLTINALPTDGALICNGKTVMKGQTIPADELEFLRFVPNDSCDFASFCFSCDGSGVNKNEFTCDMVFSTEINTAPIATDSELKTVSGIPAKAILNLCEPNGDDFTLNIITYPTNGSVTVSKTGEVLYTAREGFSGKDKLVYSVTDIYGESSAVATLNIEVEKNQSGIYFADMENSPNHLYAHNLCEENIMVYRAENGKYYFEPSNTVTKMEYLVMLMCATGLDNGITAVADSIADDDSGLSSGLKGYISAAAEKEILC